MASTEREAETPFVSTALLCPEHGLPLTLFCVETRQATCTACHLEGGAHAMYTPVPLAEALTDAQARVRDKAESLGGSARLLSHFLGHLALAAGNVRERAEEARGEVTTGVQRLRERLDVRERELVERLTELERFELDRIEERERRLRERHRALHEALGTAQELLSIQDPVEFLTARPNGPEELRRLLTPLSDPAPLSDMSYTPSDEYRHNLTEIAQHMRYFANIERANADMGDPSDPSAAARLESRESAAAAAAAAAAEARSREASPSGDPGEGRQQRGQARPVEARDGDHGRNAARKGASQSGPRATQSPRTRGQRGSTSPSSSSIRNVAVAHNGAAFPDEARPALPGSAAHAGGRQLDSASGRPVAVAPPGTGASFAHAFSDDGTRGRAAGGDDSFARAEAAAAAGDGAASAFHCALSGDMHEDYVVAVALDGRGAVISASREGAIKHWDVASQEMYPLAFDRGITCLHLDAGYLYTGGGDLLVKRWRVDGPDGAEVDAVLKGHSGPVLALATAGCYLISTSHDRSVRVWDMESGVCAAVLSGHTEAVTCVAVRGRHLYTGSNDRTVRMWDLETMTLECGFTGHGDYVRSVAVDARWLYSGSDDLTIKVWSPDTRKCLYTLLGHRGSIRTMSVAGGRLFSGSDDATCRVWDLYKMEAVQELHGHNLSVTSIDYRTGRLVTGSRDKTVRVWEET